jgi:hypothetical protein
MDLNVCYLRGRVRFPTGGKARESLARGIDPAEFRGRQYSLDGRRWLLNDEPLIMISPGKIPGAFSIIK